MRKRALAWPAGMMGTRRGGWDGMWMDEGFRLKELSWAGQGWDSSTYKRGVRNGGGLWRAIRGCATVSPDVTCVQIVQIGGSSSGFTERGRMGRGAGVRR